MTLSNIDAIFFDFGGTLYEVSEEALKGWQRILHDAGLCSLNIDNYYTAVNKTRMDFLDGYTAEQVRLGRSPQMT